MSLIQKIKDVVEVPGTESVQFKVYECEDCNHSFESAKSTDKAFCPECLSHDVEVVDEA